MGGLAQERNASAMVTEPDFLGPVAMAQFPPSVFLADTAIALRYTFMTSIARWNRFAACDPEKKALNFWGEVERLPDEVCQVENTYGELFAYSYLRTIEREFPEPTRLYTEIIRKNGYDPEDRSTDKSTAIGMGNAIGIRIAEWFGKDGWNSLGDRRRQNFGAPFEDYTGYLPVNSPWELRYPLRWQPLQANDMRLGRYTYQVHIVPFIGKMRPFLLTQDEAEAKHVDVPYEDMNSSVLSEKDAQLLDNLMREVLNTSKNLTTMQRFLASWWDNKYISVGIFSSTYRATLGSSKQIEARWSLGEMLAQHDGLVLAWKEKRRVDAVRPQSIAREFYADEQFDVYVGDEKGVQPVLGKDWEPLVTTQPHSEFPSASATMCTGFADHAALVLKEEMDRLGLTEEPAFKYSFDPNLIPFLPKGVDTVEFNSVKEAGRNCGESRLWAGVHFSPSIPAGEKLAEGIGEKAFWMVKGLSEGRVPENCWWCTKTE